ncbi:MAG: SDR family oxidoreductase, partial [Planctomycetota bacterium]
MYTLLTGATGLLGRYVMRDLLLRGRNVVVLVRPNRRSTAIERVDAILNYWERAWGWTLPRPVVLTGDIVQEGLGLSQSDRNWVAMNCRSMIHSAASLTFYEEDGEPWRSNVQGTQHVLDVCQQLNIRRLYHVSTAYTCGQRTDTIFENEPDIGQGYGNDYERSKVQAEQLVRQATWLDVAAFFRPSIIVGDSLTGFSSTFHGFYTPLRLICALQTQLSHEEVFAPDYLSLMGLTGSEGKNLVPVEWVSRAMVSIIGRCPEASQAYALTSHSPISSAQIWNVIREATQADATNRSSSNASSKIVTRKPSEDLILAAYTEQLRTYRSYWRNDPVFDNSHTAAALPDLPCPV